MYLCQYCGHKQGRKEDKCPRCFAYKMFEFIKDGRSEQASKPMQATKIRKSKIHKISTGNEAWDFALDGGLVRPSAVMVWGPPGAGKTTALVRIAESVAEGLDGEALYVSGEMPAHMVLEAALRTGSAPEHVWIWDNTEAGRVFDEIEKRKPVCVVWDSIQAFWVQGECGSDKAIKELVRRGKEVCEEVEAISLFIGQITKDGEAAGPFSIIHAVDAVIKLEQDKVSVPKKNRYGRTPKEASLKKEEEEK